MYKVGLWARVRRACMVEGMSTREAARVFGLHRDTVRKMLEYPVISDNYFHRGLGRALLRVAHRRAV